MEGPYGSDPGGPLAHHTLLKPPLLVKGACFGLRPAGRECTPRAPAPLLALGPRPVPRTKNCLSVSLGGESHQIQPATMDLLALASMKNAAKCET